MTNILEVKELYKSFGALPAVNHLSFAVQPGKIVGLLGPNGSLTADRWDHRARPW